MDFGDVLDMYATTAELWSWACAGDIKRLKGYYSNTVNLMGAINRRYTAYNVRHSLIMGAFRNNQFETVNYLLSVGETVTDSELQAVENELNKVQTLHNISHYMRKDNDKI